MPRAFVLFVASLWTLRDAEALVHRPLGNACCPKRYFPIQRLSTTSPSPSTSDSNNRRKGSSLSLSLSSSSSLDFDNYDVTDNEQMQVVYYDKEPTITTATRTSGDGSSGGTMTTAQPGDLVTVSYTGRILSSQIVPSKKNVVFDQSSAYVFRLGDGKVIPGWEQGIVGMPEGGRRVLRIPPKLAYGDRWVKGIIPPQAHLEFDIELQTIAQTKQQEFWMQLQDFGIGRAVGMMVLLMLMAVTPSLGL